MSNNIWLCDLKKLFEKFEFFPNKNECLEKQLNSVTRFILLVFIILILFDWKYAILFLIITLLFIIILYYIKRSNMSTRENFKYSPKYIDLGEKNKNPTTYGKTVITFNQNDKNKLDCEASITSPDGTKINIRSVYDKLSSKSSDIKKINNLKMFLKNYTNSIKNEILKIDNVLQQTYSIKERNDILDEEVVLLLDDQFFQNRLLYLRS